MRTFLLFVAAPCALAACGDARRDGDAGPVDAAGGDAACVASCHLPDPSCHFTDVCHCGGLVCADAGVVDAGTVDAGPGCPPSAPTDAASCAVDGQSCTYDACPGAGVARASCTGGAWHVTTTTCGSHTCTDGTTCAADEVCVSRASGAIIFSCQPNPCGSSPFDCSCAASVCLGGTCSTSGTDVACVIDCGGCP